MLTIGGAHRGGQAAAAGAGVGVVPRLVDAAQVAARHEIDATRGPVARYREPARHRAGRRGRIQPAIVADDLNVTFQPASSGSRSVDASSTMMISWAGSSGCVAIPSK